MTLRKRVISLWISLLILSLAACAPAGSGIPVTGDTPAASTPAVSSGVPPEALQAAQQWLATQFNVAADQVQIVEAEQAEWTDSCLGLGRLNESCLQALTPGWRAMFEINGQTYEVRTNEDGSTIRLAAPQGSLGAEISLENTPWSLTSFGPAQTSSPLVAGSAITLILRDGQAGGTGGCNAYGGTYQMQDGGLSFGQITRTEIACGDESVTEQEQRYFEALESADRYELDGNVLRIWYNGGADVLVFETLFPAVPAPTVETPAS